MSPLTALRMAVAFEFGTGSLAASADPQLADPLAASFELVTPDPVEQANLSAIDGARRKKKLASRYLRQLPI